MYYCELRRCHECNQPVGSKDKFCVRCGAKLPREPRGIRIAPKAFADPAVSTS